MYGINNRCIKKRMDIYYRACANSCIKQKDMCVITYPYPGLNTCLLNSPPPPPLACWTPSTWVNYSNHSHFYAMINNQHTSDQCFPCLPTCLHDISRLKNINFEKFQTTVSGNWPCNKNKCFIERISWCLILFATVSYWLSEHVVLIKMISHKNITSNWNLLEYIDT